MDSVIAVETALPNSTYCCYLMEKSIKGCY